jgi:hypothetical protein
MTRDEDPAFVAALGILSTIGAPRMGRLEL